MRRDKAILGVFDEGCMGMYNAIIPDELLHPTGVFKERLSQSALYAEMRATAGRRKRARCATGWTSKGMQFRDRHESRDRSDRRRRFWSSARCTSRRLRIADDFGCDAIGIQYQQGLKDLAPASDLAEGLLNNVRPSSGCSRATAANFMPDDALPHFNEVDECAGLDALVTNRIWTRLGYSIRRPRCTMCATARITVTAQFVWVFEISRRGASAAFHRRLRVAR